MNTLTPEVVSELAAMPPGRRVSLFVPLEDGFGELQLASLHMKNLLKQAVERLVWMGLARVDAEKVASDIENAAGAPESWINKGETLAVFGAADGTYVFWLPFAIGPLVFVGRRFYVKQVLPALEIERPFVLLALSQRKIALYRGSVSEWYREELGDAPVSLEDVLGTDWRGRELQLHSGSGRGSGPSGRQAIFHGHGVGLEEKKEELEKFFRQVDANITKKIGATQDLPLIVAGVDYLQPIYRSVTRYRYVLPEGVSGNPFALTSSELHDQAVRVFNRWVLGDLKEACEKFYRLNGTKRTTDSVDVALDAAVHGRVDTLWVATDTDVWGVFEPETGKIRHHAEREGPADEDLLNLAAGETLLHSGSVFGVPRMNMPNGKLAAAILRY
ncbi:MAG: hypothetical protein OEZ54_07935 [Gemmatimonadota bacterium]|nr:hypothetical protein [Gemmatimonadota bacterium]